MFRSILEQLTPQFKQFRLAILHKFEEMEKLALGAGKSACLRKTVTSCVLGVESGVIIKRSEIFVNRPVIQGAVCSNEVGNCGCFHSEPQAILAAPRIQNRTAIMLTRYAPCTTCANLIIGSRRVSYVLWRYDTPHDQRGLELIKLAGLGVLNMVDVETPTEAFYVEVGPQMFSGTIRG